MRRCGMLLLYCVAGMGSISAQTNAGDSPTWQKAAGGKMEFEVTSVREDKGPFKPPSFALSTDASFSEPNGRFHADFALPIYIEFAYKVSLTGDERKSMLANLPSWVGTDRFEIQATAPLRATKDQYRLMMQALLAERFGLKLHFEEKEMPVLAMTFVKPGKPGPKLIPHGQGQACDETPKPETFPKECYLFVARPGKDKTIIFGSRAISMAEMSNFVGSLGSFSGDIGRRVVDRTGVTGLWDFTLQAAAPATRTSAPEETAEGPSMLEALREQLGIKLSSTRAVVPLPVVDHVERPNAN